MVWRVGVIGAGTIGRELGRTFHTVGYDVTFYDVNEEVSNKLQNNGFNVARSLDELVARTDISFICVPTPTNGGRFDQRHVEEALGSMIEVFRRNPTEHYHVTVVKSTVLPGVVDEILRRNHYWEVSNKLGICISPEFVRGKIAFIDFFRLPFFVVSGYDPEAASTLRRFYEDFKGRSFANFEIFETTPNTACLAKYVSNCLLSCKISFFNEVAKLCEVLGVSPYDIVKLALSDRYPTHHWYLEDFLKGGFTDECLPKDLDALLSFARELGLELSLLENVKRINDDKVAATCQEDVEEAV